MSSGKGKIIEFFGPGAETLGATEMATGRNMSGEIGSISCIFPYSGALAQYLRATHCGDIADYADTFKDSLLRADEESHAYAYYDDIIDIDLSTLEPHVHDPFTRICHIQNPSSSAMSPRTTVQQSSSRVSSGAAPIARTKISRKSAISSYRPVRQDYVLQRLHSLSAPAVGGQE